MVADALSQRKFEVYESWNWTICHLRCYLLSVGLNPTLRESLGLALDRSRQALQPSYEKSVSKII